MKRATSVARDQLVSLGVCVGKFTHSDKFRLTIGALELLAAHAKHKVRPPRSEKRIVSPPKSAFFFDERRFFFSSPPRRVGRPVMRRISVFNLNLCDEKRLIPRALEGRRDATRSRRRVTSLSLAKSKSRFVPSAKQRRADALFGFFSVSSPSQTRAFVFVFVSVSRL